MSLPHIPNPGDDQEPVLDKGFGHAVRSRKLSINETPVEETSTRNSNVDGAERATLVPKDSTSLIPVLQRIVLALLRHCSLNRAHEPGLRE